MRLSKTVCLVVIALFGMSLNAAADDATDDAYAARDICVGVAANFGNVPQGATLTFNSGKFKVERGAGGQITIFEGAVPVGQIPNFDYKNYTDCIANTMKVFDAKRKRSEINRTVAFFNAAFELNNVLYIGECLQPTAMVGLYFGDMSLNADGGSNRLGSDYFNKLLIATDLSLAGRLKGYVNAATRFSLEQDVRYFTYVPGREVPYFDMGAIDQYNSYLLGSVSDQYRSYIALGQESGALSRLNALFAVLLQFDHVFANHPDPQSIQRQIAVRRSLQCIQNPCSVIRARIQQQLDDLDFDPSIQVPKLERMFTLTDDELRSDDAVTKFVSDVRRQIKSMQ